jgi:hypothetical protein
VAHFGEVWGWPDWSRAIDRTFGNRFDDCEGLYRVLYAGSAAYACYLETLARFRRDVTFYAELAEIDGPDDHVAPGVIPVDWCYRRRLGTANVDGDHADVGDSRWIAAIRRTLAREIREAGFSDFDAHVLYMTAPRLLTQQISRMVFTHKLAGIRYLSKHGSEAECWALFEGRVVLYDYEEHEISRNDSGLLLAMKTYDLEFG